MTRIGNTKWSKLISLGQEKIAYIKYQNWLYVEFPLSTKLLHSPKKFVMLILHCSGCNSALFLVFILEHKFSFFSNFFTLSFCLILILKTGERWKRKRSRLTQSICITLLFFFITQVSSHACCLHLHRASKETSHFFRVTFTEIHCIKMIHIWTQIRQIYP